MNNPAILLILGITAWIFWKASRMFYSALSAWNEWKKTKASLPGLRRGAFSKAWEAVKICTVAFIVLLIFAYIDKYR